MEWLYLGAFIELYLETQKQKAHLNDFKSIVFGHKGNFPKVGDCIVGAEETLIAGKKLKRSQVLYKRKLEKNALREHVKLVRPHPSHFQNCNTKRLCIDKRDPGQCTPEWKQHRE